MVMTRSAMTLMLATLVSLAALFAAGDACDNVPTMTWNDACHKACDNQPWYNLCPDTLKNAPVTAEVTVFALIAARLAKSKYSDTMAALDQALADGKTLPAGSEKRAAVDNCKVKYGEARGMISTVVNQLFACDFASANQEFLDAKEAIESCKNGMWWASQGSPPLFDMISANFDITMVAHDLGSLVVGKY